MSDTATTNRPEGPARGGVPALELTPNAIDSLLADFRSWLEDLSRVPGDRERETDASLPSSIPFLPSTDADFFSLVGQFTALRHEVNMQTRAARAAVEQNAEIVKQFATRESAEDAEQLRPIVKAVIDIADALTLSLRQMEKFRDAVDPLLSQPPAGSVSPGLLARIFGAKPTQSTSPDANIDKLRQLAASAADGYALSLRRVERLLPTLELEPLSCTGEAFDPEQMEVVEVIGDTEQPVGTVIEEVRLGYLWRGKLLRFAQVKVAR